jgi:hypothetical protein
MSPSTSRWDNHLFRKTAADGTDEMKRYAWIGLAAAVVFLGAAGFWGYQRWNGQNGSAREDLLALMPTDASAVLFADFDELRRAPFIARLYAWAPKPQADPDYAQFLKETGFDYERDLDRLAVAIVKHEQNSTLFALANGKFDRQKISAYAAKSGTVARTGGREIFSVPVTGSPKKISFTFLRNDQVALTDDADLGIFLSAKKEGEDRRAWRSRFERLAGSPVFAVIRQDAAAGTALAAQAPGGLRSPQLSSLLDQLQWITLAGKPENDRLRVVADGDCTAESTARQLVDLLNGVVILAQAGLNDAKTRQQLNPAAREAYLELLKNTDVSKIDRGETKSVRLVFEITPGFLEAASRFSPAAPESVPGKTLPGKAPASKKGHT